MAEQRSIDIYNVQGGCGLNRSTVFTQVELFAK